jgi:hypothetical protein
MPKTRTQFAAVKPPPLSTPRLVLSIAMFCQVHGISEGLYYKLKKQGRGPREMKVGARTLISFESAAEWRRMQENQHGREHHNVRFDDRPAPDTGRVSDDSDGGP